MRVADSSPRRRARPAAWPRSPLLGRCRRAQVPPQLDRLQRADGARVVPDRFLRRWDPVTVLFPTATGPAAGGPEDDPDRFATLAPAKPGAWTWLTPTHAAVPPDRAMGAAAARDGDGRRHRDHAGAAAAAADLHRASRTTRNGTPDLDTIALSFPQPVDLAVLARLLTIELKPQPACSGGTETLRAEDFDLRRWSAPAAATRRPCWSCCTARCADGRVATLRLRLSDEPGLDDPIFELALRSAAPFRLTDTYCGDSYNHTVKDGVTVCDPSGDEAAKPRRLVLQFSATPERWTSCARATCCASRRRWTT